MWVLSKMFMQWPLVGCAQSAKTLATISAHATESSWEISVGVTESDLVIQVQFSCQIKWHIWPYARYAYLPNALLTLIRLLT